MKDKLTIWQETTEDDVKTYFCVLKNGKEVKNISSMEHEELRRLFHMVDGLSHKLWHKLHYKVFKCCPVCKVKRLVVKNE